MKVPVIARSGAELAEEAIRLRRFQFRYAGLADTLPNGGPLGDVAAGGGIFGAWVLGETPPLSEILEKTLEYALTGQPHTGQEAAWRLPRRRWWQFWRRD